MSAKGGSRINKEAMVVLLIESGETSVSFWRAIDDVCKLQAQVDQ